MAEGSLERIALVTHPTRDVSEPVGELRRWAEAAGVEVVELWPYDRDRADGRPATAEGTDAVVSIGGDGTLLASLHVIGDDERPLMSVAWGSLAALGTVGESDLSRALDRLAAGDYEVRDVPALEVGDEGATPQRAFNDIALSRSAAGQVSLAVHVDGDLYVRLSGDGVVISTPMGSTGYGLAAGGPIVAPSAHAIVITPLASHGGFTPPVVLAPTCNIEISILHGHDRCRVDVDGQATDLRADGLRVRALGRSARIVQFGQESVFGPLRERGLIGDSPRVSGLVDERRS